MLTSKDWRVYCASRFAMHLVEGCECGWCESYLVRWIRGEDNEKAENNNN